MAKKRKQNKWRDESYNVGETSRANDGTPREEIVGALRETVLEFKDAIQVKAETEKEIDKLKEKGKKYEEEIGKLNEEVRILKEGQKDCKTLKEELRMLNEELGILKEEQKDLNKLKEEIRMLEQGQEEHKTLKEEVRILKEDFKSQIQEMQRRWAEVDHCRASPSQRSQPSESPRLLSLRIENMVSSLNYKKETVTTEDRSGRIKVAMYDGNSPIPPQDPLASAKVHLVVIEGDFNEEEPKKDSWSKEEFEKNIIKRRPGIRRLVENGAFELIGGRCDHEGAKIMDNSQQKEVKLGVRVTEPTKVRVLEGVSNPFKVQESKTKPKVQGSKAKASKKKDKKPSPPVQTPNLEQPASTHATQHGQGPVSPDEQHSLSAPVIQDVSQKEDRGKHTEFPTDDTGEDNGLSYPSATVQQMVEGNGQAQNGNGQNYRYGIQEQFLWQSTSSNSLQHGQDYGLPPPSIQNPGHCPVDQPLLAYGQDQYTSFPNASSQLAIPNQFSSLNAFQRPFNLDDLFCLQDETQMQETNWPFRCGRVLLQWDTPHVELNKHWNFLDQLMPLYSTKSRFYTERFPSTSLMDKAHKLLASISSGDSVSKMNTSGLSQATRTPQGRGVLIRPIEPYDSQDEPPLKKRAKKYQLRFVNRVCNDYYTREQIKSEDGTFLKVALYDENNLVVSGPLSSASVEVVLLHGDFNAEGQYYWTREEFSTCLVHPQSAKDPPALGGDRVLALTDGEADLGNVNFQTSSFHARTGKFKMGVVIANVREQNVQEGITSPFVVRVRLGEEPSHHRIRSLEALLRVKVKLPNQVCVPQEEDSGITAGDSTIPELEPVPAPVADDDGSAIMIFSASGEVLKRKPAVMNPPNIKDRALRDQTKPGDSPSAEQKLPLPSKLPSKSSKLPTKSPLPFKPVS